MKRLWNAVTTLLTIVVLLAAVLLVGVRFIGLRVYTVLSGSMEPAYHTGALIYVKNIDTSMLRAGDVITFMLSEDTIVTHRIVEVVPDEEDETVIRFRTKGDANNVADNALVHSLNVIGTPVFSIPYLGYVAKYIQNPPGLYVAVAAGAIILLLAFLPDLLDEKKRPSEEGDCDAAD